MCLAEENLELSQTLSLQVQRHLTAKVMWLVQRHLTAKVMRLVDMWLRAHFHSGKAQFL